MDQSLLDPSASAASCATEHGASSHFLRDYGVRQLNATLWFTLIAVTVLLLREVAKLIRLWAKGGRIPGPPCPSFYGHSELFSGPNSRENLAGLLSKSHERYGSVIKLWLGPSQLLVSIRDPILIREMLSRAGDKLPLTARAFRLAFGRSSLFGTSFEKAHKVRELLAMELNGKLFQRENITPTKIVNHVMERIHGVMAIENTDCKLISQHMAFTILGAILFGDAFLAWSKLAVYEELLMKIAKDACFWASYFIIPFWKQGFWRYQLLCLKLKCLTQGIIQHCRKNYMLCLNKKSHNETANFRTEAASGVPLSSCGVMLSKMQLGMSDDFPADAKEEQCGDLMGLMFHGFLTTASLISNVLGRLATHPEIQEEIYAEIVRVHKESEKQDQQDVEKMLLLLATVYESARLLPAGPLLQRCSIKHDLNLKGGVTIPAGAILVVPMQLVQTDTSSWGSDASQFNPYRFLAKLGMKSNLLQMTTFTDEPMDPQNSTFVLTNPNENTAFLSFGSGIRACVGQKIAILRIAMLFASFLEQYEIRLQPGSTDEPNQMRSDSENQLLPSPRIAFVRRGSHKT